MRLLTGFFISILFLSCTIVSAQQDSRYSQYMFNGLVLNPAYAGTAEDATSLTGVVRNQWVGFDGAPVTISLSAHSALKKWERVGLGINLENDKIGLNNRFNVFTSYSYKFKMGNGVLSTGLQAGFVLLQANLSGGITPDPDFDPALENEFSFRPNFGTGLFYYTDRMFVGFSIPHLLNYRFNSVGEEFATESAENRLYLLTAGYVMDINEEMKLMPSTLFKTIPTGVEGVGTLTQLDVNASLYIREMFMVGASYRTVQAFKAESMSFLLSYQFDTGLRFGYSYDHSLNGVTGHAGSHEIMIGYDISRRSDGAMRARYF